MIDLIESEDQAAQLARWEGAPACATHATFMSDGGVVFSVAPYAGPRFPFGNDVFVIGCEGRPA